MEYKYISLPIELASDELINSLMGKKVVETLLITYLLSVDRTGFSSILSRDGTEYLCESEEEFHQKVSHEKLMRML